MSPGDDSTQVLSDFVNAMLEDLGSTEYLRAILDLADTPVAFGSWADHPQQGQGRNRLRPISGVSHCSIDYFDPRGVGALRHTLTRISTASSDRTQVPRHEDVQGIQGQRSSIAEKAKGAFDFEAVLRDVLKR